MQTKRTSGTRQWFASGEPWIWMNAAAVAISIIAVVGLMLLIAVRGLAHFWPSQVALLDVSTGNAAVRLLGEIADRESVSLLQYSESSGTNKPQGFPPGTLSVERVLIKTGNRRVAPPDFQWIYSHDIVETSYPDDVLVLERTEWGNAYGFLAGIFQDGVYTEASYASWKELEAALADARSLRDQIATIQSGELNEINHRLEKLRIEQRRIELDHANSSQGAAQLNQNILEQRKVLESRYQDAERSLNALYARLNQNYLKLRLVNGVEEEVRLADIIDIWRPNTMSTGAKLRHYFASIWSFLSEDPREANTEGGIFPALFGTVMMVLLMSLLVTPFGVIAAVYLREYAKQGPFVRLIRIAVNNLAGVPSIVYGVFGLGFFVYFIGGTLDEIFFTASLPAPTFGTPGLLWASLTLALLTVPVVIVSAEEGLTRIPRSIREGSLALGATKAETLFKVVLPMASPSILTGVILAVARAAGEVAPLMLVGVVKLAPALPVDGNFPFIHLERKFMHLGFHIYDVGFQSPNVEAARPLVFATALLLILLIIVLNLTAIMLRNRLEKQYRSVES